MSHVPINKMALSRQRKREGRVRLDPEYQWVHKRFKRRVQAYIASLEKQQ